MRCEMHGPAGANGPACGRPARLYAVLDFPGVYLRLPVCDEHAADGAEERDERCFILDADEMAAYDVMRS